MKCWPVPDCTTKDLPAEGDIGSVGRDRGDRYHCGLDIFAPKHSKVLAIEDGKVVEIGEFTSNDVHDYLKLTYYVVLETPEGLYCRYGSLESVDVYEGDEVNMGQRIGRVGAVFDHTDLAVKLPAYLQELKDNGHVAKLHLELYEKWPVNLHGYYGGNIFSEHVPEGMLDPTGYLDGAE